MLWNRWAVRTEYEADNRDEVQVRLHPYLGLELGFFFAFILLLSGSR